MRVQVVPDPDFGEGSERALVRFRNGFEISVVRHEGSYGWPFSYEVWVTYGHRLRGANLIGITDFSGIVGWRTMSEVESLAMKVKLLPRIGQVRRRVRRIVKLRKTGLPHLVALADKIQRRLGVGSSELCDL